MAGKKIETYQSIKTVHECRIYSGDIRKLFKLPLCKGKISKVALYGSTVMVTFEVDSHRCIKHQLTGGK